MEVSHSMIRISTSCSADKERCITFEDCLLFATVQLPCFVSNQLLQFDIGVHNVPDRVAVYLIEQMSNVTIKGVNKTTMINCKGKASFVFANISQLLISNIGFVNCGVGMNSEMLKRIHYTVVLPLSFLPDQKFGILLVNVTKVVFDKVQVSNSTGYGIIGINLLGDSRIEDSSFENNNAQSNKMYIKNKLDCTKSENFGNCNGGNALFLYTDSQTRKDESNSTLIISATIISLGSNYMRDISPTASYNSTSKVNVVAGGGISLILLQKCYKVNFVFKDSFSFSNIAFAGANIYLNVFNFAMSSIIIIDNVTVAYGNFYTGRYYEDDVVVKLPHRYASGGGIYYEYGNVASQIAGNCTNKTQHLKYVVKFHNIKFLLNSAMNGGGAFVKLHLSPTNLYMINHTLTVDNCTFIRNKAFYGAGLFINELQNLQVFRNQPSVDNVFYSTISNTVFDQHTTWKSTRQRRADSEIASVIFLNGIKGNLILQKVTVSNSENCAGLLLIDSAVVCDEMSVINNINIANGGGAILTGQSFFILTPNSVLTIANNTATGCNGGGIYIPTVQPYSYQPQCFFQVLPKSQVSRKINHIEQYNASIKFINNTASEGYDIYGGDLENCFLMFWDIDTKIAYRNFIKIDRNQTSAVTSHAQTICFCFKNTANCNVDNYVYNTSVYPGQLFHITAVPVGQLNGMTSTDLVIAIVPPSRKNSFSMIKKHNKLQSLKNSCGNLEYGIEFPNDPKHVNKSNLVFTFNLLIDGIVQNYYWKSVTINLSTCPIFFHHDNDTQVCECISLLNKFEIKCSKEKAIIQKPPESYIGYHDNCTYFYRYCPIDRCNRTNKQLNALALNQDEQCAHGRKGLMCGKCIDGSSRVLGSNECWKCHDVNLLLLCLFAVAGLVLVWGISFFNLTVSTGEINGIIFYANIVKVNRDIFYPTLSERNPLILIIAWINLDFGIGTCLFDGMDEFNKTLIQFAFPIYLWLLSLLAIYLSRHYKIMRKILGKNSTPGLATILLLTFTKLLNIVARIFSPIKLNRECDNGKVELVLAWWSDATMPFFGTHHMILMSFGSIIIIFAIIPYILLLITSPFLQRINHYKFMHWVARIKPFLDAYEGPYNGSTQYWTGFLLFIRLALMFAFALNIYGYTTLQLFIITIVSTFLVWLTVQGKGIYRLKMLNYLEAASIVNLALYSATVKYIIISTGEIKGLKANKYVSIVSLSFVAMEIAIIVLLRVITTILNACGIIIRKEYNIKEWIFSKQHTWLGNFSRSNSKTINYNNTFTRDSPSRFYANLSECSDFEEDSWNKSVHDYREPLLNDIS